MPRPLAASLEFAHREGWWLSARNDGFWEIQKIDEEDVFKTDFEAFCHCREVNMPAEAEALRLHGSLIRPEDR